MICSDCDYAGRPSYKSPCSECDKIKGSPLCMWKHKENPTKYFNSIMTKDEMIVNFYVFSCLYFS